MTRLLGHTSQFADPLRKETAILDPAWYRALGSSAVGTSLYLASAITVLIGWFNQEDIDPSKTMLQGMLIGDEFG